MSTKVSYPADVCRVCLNQPGKHSLYRGNLMTKCMLSCAEAIMKISSIYIYEKDGHPQKICSKCLSKLKAAYKFSSLCEESNSKLQEIIKTKSNGPEQKTFDADTKIECDAASSSDEDTPLQLKIESDQSSQKENYRCQICNKHFESEESHKGAHDNKHYQCDQCAKIFSTLRSLKTHMRTHNGELLYKCTHADCSKSFPIKSRLKTHLKVHTDERPFICQYCSHAARDKQQLNVHIRYFHTKERNFKCEVCCKAFVSPQARYYHLKRHENLRNHHCTYCSKSFIFAFNLQEHLLTHTGEKRFACVICDTRFTRKAHRIKHEVRVHGLAAPSKRSMASAPVETAAMDNDS